MPRVQKKAAVKIPRRRSQTAIMTVREPGPRPWELSAEQITLLTNTVCKGATPTELQFNLEVARRHRLDPFRQQIYFVKRRDRSLDYQNAAGKWISGYKWIPIVGVNGLLHIAARDHRDFGSIEEPEYGPMILIQWERRWKEKNEWKQETGEFRAPEWARVTAWKKGFEHPIRATVYFEEIYPDTGSSPMVRQMPRHMLGKVATAHVLRKAWPATDGLYIREEFQGRPEYTPDGREITYEAPPKAGLDENAAHGHEPGSRKAEIAEEALRKVEEDDKKFLADERAAITVEAKTDVSDVWPKDQNQKKEDLKSNSSRSSSTKAAGARSSTKSASAPVEPHIAEGTITHSVAGMAGKIPVRDVTMFCPVKKTKPTFRCFDRALFEYLDKGIGKEAAVIVKQNGKYWNLTGLVKVGSQHFDDDRKTPVVSVDREPGMLNFGNGK